MNVENVLLTHVQVDGKIYLHFLKLEPQKATVLGQSEALYMEV